PNGLIVVTTPPRGGPQPRLRPARAQPIPPRICAVDLDRLNPSDTRYARFGRQPSLAPAGLGRRRCREPAIPDRPQPSCSPARRCAACARVAALALQAASPPRRQAAI